MALQDAIDKIRLTDSAQRKTRQYPYTSMWLCEQLQAEGYDIQRSTMNRHVNRGCSCGS